MVDYLTKLTKKEIKNIPYFSFDGEEKVCYVYSVYDGDSCSILFNPIKGDKGDLEDKKNLNKLKLRLTGIDTPEIKTKNEIEKKCAIEVRDWLRNEILYKKIKVEMFKFDKYGRTLCNIYNLDKSICYNEEMIKKGFAIKYDGGKKLEFNVNNFLYTLK